METLTELFESRLDTPLGRTWLKPPAFGLQATGDPDLVRQLRLGNSPALATANQILAFIEAFDEGWLNPVSSRSDSLRDSSRRERRDRVNGETHRAGSGGARPHRVASPAPWSADGRPENSCGPPGCLPRVTILFRASRLRAS